ncbi:MAG: Do family serine endopeptidase [Paludibacteraceae bacterium]|nr:Do family serine endopeptidase [Paludibacteraceae bacterium]
MKHLKELGILVAVAAVSAGVSCLYVKHYGNNEKIIIQETQQAPVQYSAYTHDGEPVDFTYAADKSVNAVVHVMTTYEVQQSQMSDPFLEYFFGERNFQQAPQKRQASGSGVILSKDGYIVTNNHVVDGAAQVNVVLNDKRQFKAQIVGTDPTTDLALLKVDADDLPTLPIGNSDNLKVGEWVLAVGNPFNLTSTVTAGIVSAKARNINILSGDMKIESFIQTDAAVNPGNSGGALVNTRGELVGINAAIASQTGSYTGYAFAIPTSIMSKVVADLKEYGTVQRALLGVQIRDIDADFAKEKNLETMEGAYVASVGSQSAASDAGIKEGDIITHVSGNKVKTVSELQEKISRFRPGDKVQITLLRNGKQETVSVTLKNMMGNTNVVKNYDTKQLGATLTPLTDKQKSNLGINYGLQVTSVEKGGRFQQAGIPKGYIILRINNQKVTSTTDVESIISTLKGEQEKALFISGILPNGKVVYYAVDMNE